MAEQGPIEMRMIGISRIALALAPEKSARILAPAVALLSAIFATAPASAQEMKEESVRVLMGYAWAITPDRFTKPNGQMVEIDRNNPKLAEVPMETAREVIRVGRLSAHAQVCDLKEEHVTNFRTFMSREAIKKKWSEQQFVFMNQLHMVTVMLLTGQLKVIESEPGKDGKDVQVVEENVGKKVSCPPEQKAKVRDAITAYLKAGPQIAPADQAAGGGPVPTPAATPASAPAPAAAPKK